MANNSVIRLINGAQSCNVFWKVGSSATLNTSTTFVGNLLAFTSITDSGGSSVNGRLLAGSTTDNTGAVTLNNTTVTKSTCTLAASSSSLSSNSATGANGVSSISCPDLSSQIVAPFIIESRRVSPTSIFFSWGPQSGTDRFNIQYGFEHGKWLYNTDVTGFSTTIGNLPPNQPIWVQIAARSDCRIGGYGVSKLIGGPKLPNTGLAPQNKNNNSWNIAIPAGVVLIVLTSIVIVLRKRTI